MSGAGFARFEESARGSSDFLLLSFYKENPAQTGNDSGNYASPLGCSFLQKKITASESEGGAFFCSLGVRAFQGRINACDRAVH